MTEAQKRIKEILETNGTLYYFDDSREYEIIVKNGKPELSEESIKKFEDYYGSSYSGIEKNGDSLMLMADTDSGYCWETIAEFYELKLEKGV